ncbi:MAG: C_GCAxxG_C_C family protein [Firmicutes bacterium]|nr:C_GCAxxG_C_C family protein [Clostridiales bacterium]MBQ4340390.1 C_GCAxxG_C_C family protein [Bacillota bacterium]
MKRADKAVEKFVGGYNCSQAVLSAYCDLYGIDELTAFKLAEGFGLGMGGYKDECGAVTGMFMVLGLENSDGEMGKGTSKQSTYAKVKECGEAFKEELGTFMCGELLRKERDMKAAATPEELAASNGKNLICIKCVEAAAKLLDEKLGEK